MTRRAFRELPLNQGERANQVVGTFIGCQLGHEEHWTSSWSSPSSPRPVPRACGMAAPSRRNAELRTQKGAKNSTADVDTMIGVVVPLRVPIVTNPSTDLE